MPPAVALLAAPPLSVSVAGAHFCNRLPLLLRPRSTYRTATAPLPHRYRTSTAPLPRTYRAPTARLQTTYWSERSSAVVQYLILSSRFVG